MTLVVFPYTNMMWIMTLLVVPQTNMIWVNDSFFVRFPDIIATNVIYGCILQ